MYSLLDKQGLLSTMRKLRACCPAFEWVDAQEGSAEEILLRLERVDWLCWFLGRLRPSEIAAFARGCADRAKTYTNERSVQLTQLHEIAKAICTVS